MTNYHLTYSGNTDEKLKVWAMMNYPKRIDEADGISVCKSCGAKYSGRVTQDKDSYYNDSYYNGLAPCQNIIPFVDGITDSGWNRYTKIRFNPAEHAHHKITKFYYDKCGHRHYTWSLEEAYNDHRGFMELLSSIQILNLGFEKYGKYLTEEAKSTLLNSLPDRVATIESKQQQMYEALQTIANKINQAGHHLSF